MDRVLELLAIASRKMIDMHDELGLVVSDINGVLSPASPVKERLSVFSSLLAWVMNEDCH